MTVINLKNKLTEITVSLNNILLDPNNPRFAEVDSNFGLISEKRFAEESIQRNALEKLKKYFDVDVLKNTMLSVGFLPIDRIVVKKWKLDDTKYVVIEGNRRIASLKSIIDMHDVGIINLSPEDIENYTMLKVLLLDQGDEDITDILIPGLRHVSGIKDWGPYQKARLIYQLRAEKSYSAKDAAESLGLSIQITNRLYRSYCAFLQMQNNEEYGEFARANLFSYFEEIMKKTSIRNWLEWNDENLEFKNIDNFEELLGWIVGSAEDDADKKIRTALDIRELAKIIEADMDIFNFFRSKEGTLATALAKIEIYHPSKTWEDSLNDALKTLNDISAVVLENISADQKKLILNLQTEIENVLKRIEKLKKDD